MTPVTPKRSKNAIDKTRVLLEMAMIVKQSPYPQDGSGVTRVTRRVDETNISAGSFFLPVNKKVFKVSQCEEEAVIFTLRLVVQVGSCV